jgi:hypothetical protein
MHDSQVAIPLASMTAKRVTNFYDLMDMCRSSTRTRAVKGAKQRGLSEGAKAGFAQIPHHMLVPITNCVISVQRSRGR